jgi:CMP-N-acetylneuraminic acid synthetase
MKISAIVPMRHDSERVPGKNYRLLGDRPLYRHIVETLLSVPEIDEVVIDTDSPTIMEDAAASLPAVRLLERPAHLRDGEIAMNDVLLNTVQALDADLFLQTHSTNPFLEAGTISRGLQELTTTPTADSLFSVTRLQARLWTKDIKPLNHDPEVLLRTQDLDPVYLENSCMYVFDRDTLVTRGNRIGAHPLVLEITGHEALDIDVEEDFRQASLVWSSVHGTSA